MRIVITDSGYIWNHLSPALRSFQLNVLVICLNGKKVTDEYQCFVTDFNSEGFLGMDPHGIQSRKYLALKKKSIQLIEELRYHDEIVFLADFSPESLYPYSVVSQLNRFNRLHLCTMSPWSFYGKQEIKAHQEMLTYLAAATSLFYMNSDVLLSEMKEQFRFPDLLKRATETYNDLLPKILYGIEHMKKGKFYFDFASTSYVPIKEGFHQIDLSLRSQDIPITKIKAHFTYATMGYVCFANYPDENSNTKDRVEELIPRLEGKKICDFLRKQRIRLANANHIEFSSEECPSLGPCGGTCQKCDDEANYLMAELEKVPEDQRIYPEFTIKEME